MHPFPLAFHCRRCILGIVISTEKVHRSLVGGCLYVVDSEDSTTSSIRRMANPIMQAGVMSNPFTVGSVSSTWNPFSLVKEPSLSLMLLSWPFIGELAYLLAIVASDMF